MSPRQQWIAFATLIRREVRRFLRIWVQTLVPAAITMALYFVIFGRLMGERIGQMSGHSYIEFVAPGLIIMSIITNSYGNVVSSFFGNKYARYLEELLVSPMPTWLMLAGFVLGGMVRGLLVGIIVSLVALYFTNLPVHSPLMIAVTALLTALLFSLMGLINGIFARNFDDISIIPTFVLAPLSYLGGIFYSISLLPPFWQTVSKANPILHMVGSFRYGFLGVDETDVRWGIGIMLGLTVALTALALHLLEHSKRLRS